MNYTNFSHKNFHDRMNQNILSKIQKTKPKKQNQQPTAKSFILSPFTNSKEKNNRQ